MKEIYVWRFLGRGFFFIKSKWYIAYLVPLGLLIEAAKFPLWLLRKSKEKNGSEVPKFVIMLNKRGLSVGNGFGCFSLSVFKDTCAHTQCNYIF